MSENIIPIVSNTPPPIDDGDDDFDDNFQSFESNRWESDNDFGAFAESPDVPDSTETFSEKNFEPNECLSFNATDVFSQKQTATNMENISSAAGAVINKSITIASCPSVELNCNSSINTHDESLEPTNAAQNRTVAASQLSQLTNFPDVLIESSEPPDKKATVSISSEVGNDDMKYSTVIQKDMYKAFDDAVTEIPVSQANLNFNDENLSSKVSADPNNCGLLIAEEKIKVYECELGPSDVASSSSHPTVLSTDNPMSVESFQGSFDEIKNTLTSQSASNSSPVSLEECDSLKNIKYDSDEDSTTFQPTKTDLNSNKEANENMFDADFGNFANAYNNTNDETVWESDAVVVPGNEEFTAFAEFNTFNHFKETKNSSTEPCSTSASQNNFSVCQNNEFASFPDDLPSQHSPSQDASVRDETNSSFADKEDDLHSSGFCGFNESTSSKLSSFPENSKSFANFESNKNNDDFNDFDDFGDFGSADSCFDSKPVKNLNISMSGVISYERWFPLSGTNHSNNDLELHSIDHHVEKELLSTSKRSPSRNSTASSTSGGTLSRPPDTWSLLQDVDNAVALSFQWSSSMSQQQLLKALNVDSQHILFKGGNAPYYVPTYYAAGLGLLQPDSGQSHIPTSPFSSADDSSFVQNAEMNSGRACPPGERALPGVSPPPLTNPLSGEVLNLDLLDETFSKSARQAKTSQSEQDGLDPELLELALGGNPDVSEPKKSDPLARILASLKVSGAKKNSDEEENLSEDAIKVLRQLPDLSYMRSRVLMFPVGQPTAH